MLYGPTFLQATARQLLRRSCVLYAPNFTAATKLSYRNVCTVYCVLCIPTLLQVDGVCVTASAFGKNQGPPTKWEYKYSVGINEVVIDVLNGFRKRQTTGGYCSLTTQTKSVLSLHPVDSEAFGVKG